MKTHVGVGLTGVVDDKPDFSGLGHKIEAGVKVKGLSVLPRKVLVTDYAPPVVIVRMPSIVAGRMPAVARRKPTLAPFSLPKAEMTVDELKAFAIRENSHAEVDPEIA